MSQKCVRLSQKAPDGLGKMLGVHKTFIIVAESLQILPHIDLGLSYRDLFSKKMWP